MAGAGGLPSHSESASVSHPLSYPAGRCKLARGQAQGQQDEGEEEEEEEAPEEDEEGEFLFISGRLASWSVWTRLTVPWSRSSLPTPVMFWLVLLVTLLALCFLRSRQAQMLDIMAGLDQKSSYVVLPCHDAEAVSRGPDCSADS